MSKLEIVLAIECPKNDRMQDILDCIIPGDKCPFYLGVTWDDEEHLIEVDCGYGVQVIRKPAEAQAVTCEADCVGG